MAGYKELLAVEWENNAAQTFELNFPDVPIWQKDITEITGQGILDFCGIKKGDLDVLDGSPPCQGFSTIGKRDLNDERNDLYLSYVRLIKELSPKIFVMENVPGMLSPKFKSKFNKILRTFKQLDYIVKCRKLNAMYYGVPQARERLIFIGVRKDLKMDPSYPQPNRKIKVVKDILEKHPVRIKAKRSILRYGDMVVNVYAPSVTIVKASRYFIDDENLLTELELKRIQSFPEDFKFIGTYTNIQHRIGNSVPPLMMKAIAKNIKDKILCR